MLRKYSRRLEKHMKYSLTLRRKPSMISMARLDSIVSSIYSHYKLNIASSGGSTGGSFRGFPDHDFFTFTDAERIFKNFFGGRDPF